MVGVVILLSLEILLWILGIFLLSMLGFLQMLVISVFVSSIVHRNLSGAIFVSLEMLLMVVLVIVPVIV